MKYFFISLSVHLFVVGVIWTYRYSIQESPQAAIPPSTKDECNTLPPSREDIALVEKCMDLTRKAVEEQKASSPSAEQPAPLKRSKAEAGNAAPPSYQSVPTPPGQQEKLEQIAKVVPLRELQDETEFKLARELPATEAAVLETKVARGTRLKKEGLKAPAYRALMTSEIIESLAKRGLLRIAVVEEREKKVTQLFLFAESWERPGRPRLAMPSEMKHMSERTSAVDPFEGRSLVHCVRDAFNLDAATLYAVFLLRTDLDAMVLGAQYDAAEALGLRLEELERTLGQFRTKRGLPFDYQISEVFTTDGRSFVLGDLEGSAASSRKG